MHGMIAISFILLAIVAGMFLLAKTQKEQLGLFFKIVSYIVISIGFLCLICCVTRSICRMTCGRQGCMPNERCMMMPMHGGMMHGNCCMMPCHGEMMGKECCDKKMGKECHGEMEDDDDKAKDGKDGAESHPAPPPPQGK